MRFRLFTGYKDWPYGEFMLAIPLDEAAEEYLIFKGFSTFGRKEGKRAYKIDQ